MNSLFLMIPHVVSNFEIVCQNEKIMHYLYNMFTPYISFSPRSSIRYDKLVFLENDNKDFICDTQGEKRDNRIVSYIEKYFLMNLIMDKGFLMLHGGGVAYNNQAFIFLANSMVGKSTLITHLCLEGFQYITDDRLIIDTNEKMVLPYTKTIMLRPEGKNIITNLYGNEIETIPFQYKSMRREFYTPHNCINKRTKINSIFILIRRNGEKLRREKIENSRRVFELLKYSMSIKSCQNIQDFIKLSSIKVEILYFSDLNEMTRFLKETSYN